MSNTQYRQYRSCSDKGFYSDEDSEDEKIKKYSEVTPPKPPIKDFMKQEQPQKRSKPTIAKKIKKQKVPGKILSRKRQMDTDTSDNDIVEMPIPDQQGKLLRKSDSVQSIKKNQPNFYGPKIKEYLIKRLSEQLPVDGEVKQEMEALREIMNKNIKTLKSIRSMLQRGSEYVKGLKNRFLKDYFPTMAKVHINQKIKDPNRKTIMIQLLPEWLIFIDHPELEQIGTRNDKKKLQEKGEQR